MRWFAAFSKKLRIAEYSEVNMLTNRLVAASGLAAASAENTPYRPGVPPSPFPSQAAAARLHINPDTACKQADDATEPRHVQLAAWVECQVLGTCPRPIIAVIPVANGTTKRSIHTRERKPPTTPTGLKASPTRSTPTDVLAGTTRDITMMASYKSTICSAAPSERITVLGGSSGATTTLRRRTLGIPMVEAEW